MIQPIALSQINAMNKPYLVYCGGFPNRLQVVGMWTILGWVGALFQEGGVMCCFQYSGHQPYLSVDRRV